VVSRNSRLDAAQARQLADDLARDHWLARVAHDRTANFVARGHDRPPTVDVPQNRIVAALNLVARRVVIIAGERLDDRPPRALRGELDAKAPSLSVLDADRSLDRFPRAPDRRIPRSSDRRKERKTSRDEHQRTRETHPGQTTGVRAWQSIGLERGHRPIDPQTRNGCFDVGISASMSPRCPASVQIGVWAAGGAWERTELSASLTLYQAEDDWRSAADAVARPASVPKSVRWWMAYGTA
jgi:hypothetical protein